MSCTRNLLLFAAVLAALTPYCRSASTADTAALNKFSGTALAPFSSALIGASGPVEAGIAHAPLFQEALGDPPSAASVPQLNALLNDPNLLQQIRTQPTLQGLLNAIPPAQATALSALINARTTGALTPDYNAVAPTVGGGAAGSRKLLGKLGAGPTQL